MKFDLVPSLRHIALVKIAVSLWDQDCIRDFIAATTVTDHWSTVESRVEKEVPHLPLPIPLKEELISHIKPIGYVIEEWMYLINSKIDSDADVHVFLPPSNYWTMLGRIDVQKWAKVLIENESWDIPTRYKLACHYCFETHIRMLWGKMSSKCKKKFYVKGNPRSVDQEDLVKVWTYDLNGDLLTMSSRRNNCSPYQLAFQYAAVHGNKLATAYFLQKLTLGEMEVSIRRVFSEIDGHLFLFQIMDFKSLFDVMRFLLSEISEEQEIEVFRTVPHLVLTCLLSSPWQRFFWETANRLWDFLATRNYFFRILCNILIKIECGLTDFDYQKLLWEFWERSPDDCKNAVFNDDWAFSLLVNRLIAHKDTKTIRLFVKDASAEQTERFSASADFFFNRILFKARNWEPLKFFIQEFLSSKNLIIKTFVRLKSRPIKNLFEERRDRWIKVFQVLRDLMLSKEERKRRSLEEGNRKRVKRICNAD